MTTKKVSETHVKKESEKVSEHDLKENIGEIAEKIKDKAIDLEEKLEKLGFIKDLLGSECLSELVKKFLNNGYFWQILGGAFVVLGGWGVLSVFGHWHYLFQEILFVIVGGVSVVQGVGLIAAKKWTSVLSLVNLLVILSSVVLGLLAYQRFLFDGLGTTLWVIVISFAVLLFVIKAKGRFEK